MDWLQKGINQVLTWVTAMLPDSPFKNFANAIPHSVLANVNWVIDFGAMASILVAWTAAIAVFYLYRVILAWVKAVGS